MKTAVLLVNLGSPTEPSSLSDLREVVDALEQEIPADLWPLPTYREMLHVK